MKNKAQIGSTMTWIVAMGIIIFILLIYIVLVGWLFKVDSKGNNFKFKYTEDTFLSNLIID